MIRTLFVLGRVSNLPTVFTNVLAGVYLAGGRPADLTVILLVVATAQIYVGGMYLNDAFDADWDRQNRPERPIPTGKISRKSVYVLGFSFLGTALVILTCGVMAVRRPSLGVLCGIVLCGLVVTYDILHKRVPGASILMGASRAMIYVMAFTTIGIGEQGWQSMILAPGLLFFYVIGLTETAKTEHLIRAGGLPLCLMALPLLLLFPQVVQESPLAHVSPAFLLVFVLWAGGAVFLLKRNKNFAAVGFMIAGISVLDAVLISAYSIPFALGALILAGMTVLLQRIVPGT